MGPYGYAKECFETETRSLTFLGLKGFLFFFFPRTAKNK